MQHLAQYIKVLTMGGWLLSSEPSAAQSTLAQLDLSQFMESSQLTLADVYQVGSLHDLAGEGLSRASFGDADPAWFVVQSSYEPLAIVKKGLRIRFHIFGFDVESCRPEGCQTVHKSTMKSSDFSLDGLKISVQLSGFPCGKKPSCEYFLPSWSLGQMARNGGSVSGIPNVLSYVQHRGGLTLFNTETKQRWLDLFPDGVPLAYGLLQQISQLGDAVILLRFDHAMLALDLAKDLAVLADRHGLFKSSHGLGYLNEESFVALLLPPSSQNSPSAPIAFTRELVAWTDRSMLWRGNWQVSHLPLVHPEVFRSAELQTKGLMRYLAVSDGSVRTYDLRLSDGSVFQVAQTQLAGVSHAEDLFLQRGHVLLRQDSGISLLKDDTKLSSSLSGLKSMAGMAIGSDIFLKETTAESCLWRHYQGHERIAESFRESGLQSNCAKLQNFNSTATAASITNFDGRYLTIKALFK